MKRQDKRNLEKSFASQKQKHGHQSRGNYNKELKIQMVKMLEDHKEGAQKQL